MKDKGIQCTNENLKLKQIDSKQMNEIQTKIRIQFSITLIFMDSLHVIVWKQIK